MTVWCDSHCHLDDGAMPDGADTAIRTARDAGVDVMVTIGTDAERSAAAVTIARRHEGVWATIGLHPHDAGQGADFVGGMLDGASDVAVAVGECGLDYHYDHSPRPVQREVFAAQVALARERDLALVVHTREAWDDTLAILRAEGPPERTIIHCFTGGPDEARRCLDLGAYVSFSGIVTFKNADDVRAACALCPLDRLLVETDAPYLAPAPHRGRPNSPALVPVVGAAVAAVRGDPVELVAKHSFDNAALAFQLDHRIA